MRIPSSLGATTLGDVLGALHRERMTGTLELIESSGASSGRIHRIHLREGLVSGIETAARTRRLGDILRGEGLLEPGAERLLDRVPLFSRGRLYGRCLLDAQIVTPEALGQALGQQQRDRLDALYRLRDARLCFRVARRGAEVAPVPLGPVEFLHGRPRARQGSEPVRRDPVHASALATLGLPPDASRADVRDAFRRLAREGHPDRYPGASAEERAHLAHRFSAISTAYHRLIA